MTKNGQAPVDVDVVIIGAGFAGLGMGIRLLRERSETFVVLERADDVGGTWRDNTYPGVACDVPSHLYSLSYRPKPDWSRVFSPGREIWAYLRSAAEEEGLIPHIRFGTNMERSTWDESTSRWIVETSNGTYRGRFLVLAAGHLADEHLPGITGLSEFEGSVFHSARWDHTATLEGKRVGVVGSGASAIQIVPAIVDSVAELVVFQRSAPWVMPRGDRAYTQAEMRMFERDPDSRTALRDDLFWTLEANYATRRQIEPFFSNAKAMATAQLENQVQDRELRTVLTPDYELGCKRVLLSNDYYPAVSRDHVTVEPSALDHVGSTNAVSALGTSYDLDVLIFATGFDATEPRYGPQIVGRDGLSLSDAWARGMRALDSTAVSGFPNLFIINGPNTGLGHNSIVYVVEAQVDYILGALRFAADNEIASVEATPDAEQAYVDRLRLRSAGTVWLDGGCKSWYVDPRSGELTIIWPDFAHSFRDDNAEFAPDRYQVVHT